MNKGLNIDPINSFNNEQILKNIMEKKTFDEYKWKLNKKRLNKKFKFSLTMDLLNLYLNIVLILPYCKK